MNNKSVIRQNNNSMIAQLRAIRDKISLEIKDFNKEQMKAYFNNKKSLLPWKDPELQKQYLTEIGFDESTGLTQAEKNQGFTAIDEKGIPIKKEKKSTTTESNSSTEVPKSTQTSSNSESNSNGTATPMTATTASSSSPTIPPSNVATTAPVQSDPTASKALNTAQKDNLVLNVPVSKPDPSTVAVNQSANVSKGGKPRGNIPLVRNNEVTIQRMIYNNTRVV